MKIKTRGSQAFNVPNTDEGHVFLQLLRKFRNRGWHYRSRGRGSRKEHGCQHGIGQEHSEWMAVYLDGTKAKQLQQERLNQIYQLQQPFAVDLQQPFVVDHGVANVKVAGWSEPIQMGNSVGITNGGLAYNADRVHEQSMEGYGKLAGLAVTDHVGSIGRGEAQVQTHFLLSPAPEPHHPFCGCDEAAGFKCVEHNKVDPEDTVELTQEEQTLLDKILLIAAKGFWVEDEHKTLDNLINKLVD